MKKITKLLLFPLLVLTLLATTFANEGLGTTGKNDQVFLINGVQVKVLQHEYEMTMGEFVGQIQSKSYIHSIYMLFIENKGHQVEAPLHFFDHYNMDLQGAYYKQGQFDFLSLDEESIQRFDLYTLVKSHPPEELLDYPDFLLYDATMNQWYLFNEAGSESIYKLIEDARRSGCMKIINQLY